MPLTDVGVTHIAQVLIAESPTEFNNANAHLGVGDSATAFAAAQTDLQAATNKVRQSMNATYPSRSGDVLTFQATFTTGQANFAWNEWGVFNASSAGTMLSRKVESLGTKTSAAAWQLEVDLTVNNP